MQDQLLIRKNVVTKDSMWRVSTRNGKDLEVESALPRPMIEKGSTLVFRNEAGVIVKTLPSKDWLFCTNLPGQGAMEADTREQHHA